MTAPVFLYNGKPAPGMAAEGIARSDAEASNSAAQRKLYKSRVPIYPKEQDGLFRSLKWGMMAITLSIYYLVPWLRWDRGPDAPGQAVLVDLAHACLPRFRHNETAAAKCNAGWICCN